MRVAVNSHALPIYKKNKIASLLCIFETTICVVFCLPFHRHFYPVWEQSLSYDVASGSEISPYDKIDKPLVVYRFTGNVMTSITTLRT